LKRQGEGQKEGKMIFWGNCNEENKEEKEPFLFLIFSFSFF